ncbi:MAG: hypothetical protein JWM12_3498 [Ilumatobacteraceae bacterium]|nr:hypothetical protein [Ilumatobacteraceae bacterium]
MLTTGSKLTLGGTALSVLGAIVWGITKGGSVGYVGVLGLTSAAAAFLLLFVVVTYLRDANVPPSAPDALTGSAAAQPPPTPSMWPVVAAFGVGLLVVGAVTKPIVFKAAIVVLAASAVEWMVQAWSERASSDPAYNASLRKRIIHPLELPVLVAVGVAVLVYSFSRIMLFLSKSDGPYAFIIVGVLIVAFAFTFAARPTLKKGVIVAVCTVAALGVVSTGAVMAISGQRTITKHPTTADEDHSQCLRDAQQVASNPEYEEIEHRASQHVSAKSNPAAKVILENGQLHAEVVGAQGPQVTLTIARSNPTNILFINRDSGEFRLTAYAGTDVQTVNDTQVKIERLSCTTLIHKDGEQMFTVAFPKSSAAATPDDPYRLFVPGLDGQQITVYVP